MKKTITVFTTVMAVLVISLMFSSCKKGDAGPAGPTGAAGKNGTSNVQSYSVTTNNLSWVLDNSDNSYNSIISVPAITADVLNVGTIQVFYGDGTSTQWGALPFSYGTVQYNYSYKIGQVILSVTLSNGNVPGNPGGQQFKVVVIPPAARLANPNVNLKNYNEVKKAYNLKD